MGARMSCISPYEPHDTVAQMTSSDTHTTSSNQIALQVDGELVSTTPRRGALEHHYKAVVRPLLGHVRLIVEAGQGRGVAAADAEGPVGERRVPGEREPSLSRGRVDQRDHASGAGCRSPRMLPVAFVSNPPGGPPRRARVSPPPAPSRRRQFPATRQRRRKTVRSRKPVRAKAPRASRRPQLNRVVDGTSPLCEERSASDRH